MIENLAKLIFKLIFLYIVIPSILLLISVYTMTGSDAPVLAAPFIWMFCRLVYDLTIFNMEQRNRG